MLFLLLLLRQPRLQLIYVTGRPIARAHRRLLPRAAARRHPAPRARAGCTWSPPHDGSARPLAAKLLERPRVLDADPRADPRPGALPPRPVHDVRRSSATSRSRSASRSTAPTRGSCRSARRPAAGGCSPRPGVRHPLGHEDLHDVDDVVDALAGDAGGAAGDARGDRQAQRGRRRARQRGGRPARPARARRGRRARRRCAGALEAMAFEHADMPARRPTSQQLARDGGIVEERVDGAELRSPSVQLRVTPLGEVELLSTHDQLLGGPSGQSYLGLPLPGRLRLRAARSRARRRRSARGSRSEGVLGRFAIDFVVVRGRARRAGTPYAIELNLRKGGTTHPFLTLQFLTDGALRPGDGALHRAERAREAPRRDATTSSRELLRGLTIDDLFDIAVRHRLHFDQAPPDRRRVPHDERAQRARPASG